MQIRKLIASSFKKAMRYDSCADPGISVRWEGGLHVHLANKTALTTFFLIFIFFSPQLILLKSSGYFQRKLLFAKVPVGAEHFPGGPTFYRGGGGPISFSL